MKNRYCMYGYMDESGSPGIAISNNDYFVVSIVLFQTIGSAERAMCTIDRLRKRLQLPENYEFHRKNNSVDKQAAFIELAESLDFCFITVAIKKSHSRKVASYSTMSKLLLDQLPANANLRLRMDINPILHRELAKEIKLRNYRNIKVKEVAAHKENLLQLADYIVNLSYASLKRSPKPKAFYAKIKNKNVAFIISKG